MRRPPVTLWIRHEYVRPDAMPDSQSGNPDQLSTDDTRRPGTNHMGVGTSRTHCDKWIGALLHRISNAMRRRSKIGFPSQYTYAPLPVGRQRLYGHWQSALLALSPRRTSRL